MQRGRPRLKRRGISTTVVAAAEGFRDRHGFSASLKMKTMAIRMLASHSLTVPPEAMQPGSRYAPGAPSITTT
jgi:hypothetical protein